MKIPVAYKPRWQSVLLAVALALLGAGFAGPWVYGPLGKTGQWGWQPVWGLLLSLVGVNLFALASLASCFSYVEQVYRQGHPPLSGLLKWIAGFLGLVILIPLVSWTALGLPVRDSSATQPDNAFGWGMWLALSGLILQVAAHRIGRYTGSWPAKNGRPLPPV